MYIIDTKRKVYYNTKLNKILDLNELKYVKNDKLVEYYKQEIAKHVVLNEKLKLIEESNKIYTGIGYLIDENGNWFSDAYDSVKGTVSKAGEFLKGMVPDSLEDWIHLGIDVISGLFDAFGAVTFGGTNVISLIIDILHGLYYIGAAYGIVGSMPPEKKDEYLLMGMITMGFAFVPGIGNAANIALKGTLKSSVKSGAKTFVKKILGSGVLYKAVKGVFKFFFKSGPKAVLKAFKTVLEYLSGYRLIRWLFKKLGIKKITGFFFKNADRVLDDMATSKFIKALGKEIEEPVSSMATKTVTKITRETAKDALQISASKQFTNLGLKKATEKAAAQKAMKELQKELVEAAAKKGSNLSVAEAEKIGIKIANKYSSKISNAGFETAMKNLGKDTRNILVSKTGLTKHLGGLKSTLKHEIREPIYQEVQRALKKKLAHAEAKGATKAEINAIEKASKLAVEDTYKVLSKKGIKTGTKKELDKIITNNIAKVGNRVTSKAGKEALEDVIKSSVKTVAKHNVTRHFTGAAFKKLFVKQLAAGNLIYSDNAKNMVISLLELLGLRPMPNAVENSFIEALKSVKELVPNTTREQLEQTKLDEDGIKILQTFLNKFPEYNGKTEFGEIVENGVLDARTIIGEQYFITNMNNFLKDGTIYGYEIDFESFNKHIVEANDKMAKIGEEIQKENTSDLTENDLDKINVEEELSAASEAVIRNFNKYVNTML